MRFTNSMLYFTMVIFASLTLFIPTGGADEYTDVYNITRDFSETMVVDYKENTYDCSNMAYDLMLELREAGYSPVFCAGYYGDEDPHNNMNRANHAWLKIYLSYNVTNSSEAVSIPPEWYIIECTRGYIYPLEYTTGQYWEIQSSKDPKHVKRHWRNK